MSVVKRPRLWTPGAVYQVCLTIPGVGIFAIAGMSDPRLREKLRYCEYAYRPDADRRQVDSVSLEQERGASVTAGEADHHGRTPFDPCWQDPEIQASEADGTSSLLNNAVSDMQCSAEPKGQNARLNPVWSAARPSSPRSLLQPPTTGTCSIAAATASSG